MSLWQLMRAWVRFITLVIRGEGRAWVAVCEAGVYQPDQLPSISGEHWVGIGSAWGLHEVSLNRQYRHNIVSMVTEVVPQASAMIQLAEPVFEKGDAKSANQARPIYIRNKVALTTKVRELGLRLWVLLHSLKC